MNSANTTGTKKTSSAVRPIPRTRYAPDTPKSEAGHRTIAIGARLTDELFEHRARSAFN